MAKDDPGGLLSKVVRFVRNPATNWSDLDEPESVGDSGNSRQMLKELVERKKRNDFVRKREFEMLRKLRRREMAGSQASAPRPSFFSEQPAVQTGRARADAEEDRRNRSADVDAVVEDQAPRYLDQQQHVPHVGPVAIGPAGCAAAPAAGAHAFS